MSKDTSTKRVIEILKDLEEGKILNLANLCAKYDVSERTLRRDLELIKDIFGEIFTHLGDGNYQSLQKTLFKDMLNSSEFFMLQEIIRLSNKSSLEISKNLSPNIKDKFLKNADESPYLFKHKPFEEIFARREIFKILERAITYKKEISLTYTNLDKISHFTIEPYKIAFLEQNFYLVGLEKKHETHYHKILRIAMISDIKFSGREFRRDPNYLDFLDFMHSPWANYRPDFRQKLFKVKVQIPKEQSKYFKLKKFYPTQEILCENDDGSIDVEYSVMNYAEIMNVIKQWIPHMRILSPNSLKRIVRELANEFYEKTNLD